MLLAGITPTALAATLATVAVPLPLQSPQHLRGRVASETRPRVASIVRLAVHLPVAALIVAYAIRFSLLSISVYDGFGDPPYDMALFDQGIWLLSRFHAPFVTVMGRNLFGDHTCFILLLAVPIYWVYPHAQALLVLQSCLLAGAAVPIYLLGRRLLHSTVLATALAAAYLLNPALQNGNLEQFHPEAFLTLALSIAVYAAVTWRPRLLVGAVIAALLCKQDTALLIIPLGGWVLWRRNRRLGLLIMAGAAAWMAIAFEVIIKSLLGTASFNSTRIPFGGVTGLIKAIFTEPGQVWSYIKGNGRPWYLWQMASSVGWGFLFSPEIAAIVVLTFLENELADFVYMHQILYHYSMPLVPVLVAGTVFAISRLKTPNRRRAATTVVTSCALVACFLWGLAPFSRHTYAHMSPSNPEVGYVHQALKALPPNGIVSAFYPWVAHIDHRTRIYMWPTPFAAKYWDLYQEEGQRLSFAGQITYLVLPTDLTGSDATTFATISRQYRVIKRVGNVAVYKKIVAPVKTAAAETASATRGG
jgi:uncharacterized membrane protein